MSRDALIPSPAVYGSSQLPGDLGDVHVESLAISNARHEHRIRRHRHSDLFQFFVMQSCDAACQLDSEQHHLRGSGLLIVPALVVHQFHFEPGAVGQVVSISHAMLHEFERLSGDCDWIHGLSTPNWIPLDAAHEIFTSGEALFRCYNGPQPRRLHITAMALRLVSDIVGVCDSQTEKSDVTPTAQQALVDEFIADIELHYDSDDSLSDYCSRLKVTERTLRRATTACLQLSPIAILHRRKCLEAQRLLRFTSLSIAEVAYAIGFSDPSYFSRRFKKLTGVVPRDIRP